MLAYITSLDSTHKKLSLGSYNMNQAISNAIDDGFKEFDLLRGGKTFKRRFCKDYRENHRIKVYNRNWRARLLYLYLEAVKPFLKKLIQKPAVLRLRRRLIH